MLRDDDGVKSCRQHVAEGAALHYSVPSYVRFAGWLAVRNRSTALTRGRYIMCNVPKHLCAVCLLSWAGVLLAAETKPATPRIDSIVLAPVQPHAKSPHVIWYDDFDGAQPGQWKYLEPRPDSPDASLSDRQALGGQGRSMECFYPKGKQGIGNRKIVFGDCPIGRPLRKGERFEDVYWRIYVKHQKGWTGGGPAKMSRATAFVSGRWDQAFILHLWSAGDVLTLDPVTGVRNGRVVTTRYNDFDNFKWLGNSPKGKFPIHAAEESARWVCVEARLKLNTPGQKDGYSALWIDGRLDTERKNIDYRGEYTQHTINAIFLEAYWNDGSPVDQYRWYDDFVVSTRPIGPLTAAPNPTLIRTSPDDSAAWEVEIAADPQGQQVVWKSLSLPTQDTQVAVRTTTGAFSGAAAGKSSLPAGPMYFCRVRQRSTTGAWSDWSALHQPFVVAAPTP